jgi:hypothetical protein
MNRTSEDIRKLVDFEMERITDLVVQDALKAILVHPSFHIRDWDWGKPGEKYPCWMVAEHKESGTGIVYSDFGFGPERPWGLVFLSDSWFGLDSGWFSNLEDSFCDCHASTSLPIWNVVRKKEDGSTTAIATDLSLDEAFEKRDELNASFGESIYAVKRREK